MCTNLPNLGHRLPKHLRQRLSPSKVAHSERNLSPLEKIPATRKRQRNIWERRDVTKNKSAKTLSNIKLFTSFPGKDCIFGCIVTKFRPRRLLPSDSLALSAKVRGTDGDISVHRFTVSKELWVFADHRFECDIIFQTSFTYLHCRCGKNLSFLKGRP